MTLGTKPDKGPDAVHDSPVRVVERVRHVPTFLEPHHLDDSTRVVVLSVPSTFRALDDRHDKTSVGVRSGSRPHLMKVRYHVSEQSSLSLEQSKAGAVVKERDLGDILGTWR